MAKKEKLNEQTGELVETTDQLNIVKIVETLRPNGTLRQQQDFSLCPTMTEQHTAHLSDLNYLMDKYRPDELAAYVAARNQYRQEILGHDFSLEPTLQDAKSQITQLKNAFNMLPEDFKKNFKNHVEFLKYIDNADNQAKLIKSKILTEKQVQTLSSDSITTPKKEETVSEKT